MCASHRKLWDTFASSVPTKMSVTETLSEVEMLCMSVWATLQTNMLEISYVNSAARGGSCALSRFMLAHGGTSAPLIPAEKHTLDK